MKERIIYYDQMRGIAILLVVIGHVLLFSFGTSDNSVFSMLTIFHMPVFFFISGYFAYKNIPTMKEWWKRFWKRVHALVFPYLVVSGIYCIFRDKNYYNLLITGGAEYWFLYVLLLLTVFFMAFELLARRIEHPILYVLAYLLPYAILILVQHRYGEVGGGIFSINQLVAYYRFYLLGFLCRKYVKLNEFVFFNKYVYAIGFVAFFARWYWSGSCNMIVSFLGITGAIIILHHFFVTSERQDSHPMRVLAFLGQNSLEIYLFQYFFLPDFTGFIKPFVNVPNGFIWQLLLALVITIPITAACVVVGMVIKKNRVLNWVLLGRS